MIFESPDLKHCDEYIRDKSQPKALRKFLLYQRIPAVWQEKWKARGWPVPVLFATYKPLRGIGGSTRKNKPRRVRVTFASRFGDVGITPNPNQEHGYRERVRIEQLTEVSETP